MQVRREVQTDETLPLSLALPLAVQHLMAMFGATMLVPILMGLDPSIRNPRDGPGHARRVGLNLALPRPRVGTPLAQS